MTDLIEAMGIGSASLYASFVSKEALYLEALQWYRENHEALVWSRFLSAPTAREAVACLLMDSAAVLTGCVVDIPRGCMVTLSSVGGKGHAELGDVLRSARAVTLERLTARIDKGIATEEIPASVDAHALARFVQTLQNGMSILARDGASRAELEAVTEVAMMGWDMRCRRRQK
jgi:AcrR family transcriptional regulator